MSSRRIVWRSELNVGTGSARCGDRSTAQSQSIRACSLSFFNKYLEEQDDYLLENPSAFHSNTINLQSK